MSRAFDVIEQAAHLVGGDRATQHGDKSKNFENIAALWTAYLGENLSTPLEPDEVCLMMTLLKVARTKSGAFNMDDYVDAIGYAGIAGELADASRHQSDLDERED